MSREGFIGLGPPCRGEFELAHPLPTSDEDAAGEDTEDPYPDTGTEDPEWMLPDVNDAECTHQGQEAENPQHRFEILQFGIGDSDGGRIRDMWLRNCGDYGTGHGLPPLTLKNKKN